MSIVYVLGLSLVVFFAFLVFSEFFGKYLLPNQPKHSLIILLVYSLSIALSSLLFAYLRGMDRVKAFSFRQIEYQALSLILCLILIGFCGVDVIFLAWSFIGILYVFVCFFVSCGKSRCHLLKKFDAKDGFSHMKYMSCYSIPRLFGDIFLFCIAAFPVLYISRKISLEATSNFSVGITLVTMVTPFFSFLGVVLLPYVSRCAVNDNFNQAKIVVSKLGRIYFVLAIIATCFLYCFMPILIRLFFAEKYLIALPVARLTTFSILPLAMYYLYRNPIDAISTFPYNTIILLFSLILLIALCVHSNSVLGIGRAYVICSLLQGLLSMFCWIYLRSRVHE